MMQMRRRWLSALLAICLLVSSVVPVTAAESDKQTRNDDWIYEDTGSGLPNYREYYESHMDAEKPETEISVDITKFVVLEPLIGGAVSGTGLYQDKEGSATGVDIKAMGEDVVFTVEVPQTGLYSLEMKYFADNSVNTQIMFALMIDGELPFVEANGCRLNRVFQNLPVQQDKYGDDLRPQNKQLAQWQSQFLMEQTGVYGAMQFYLEAGTHEIAVCFDGTPLLLEAMTFKQTPYQMSYADYIAAYVNLSKNTLDSEGGYRLFQAENYLEQSASTLWPDYDNSSSLTIPFSYKNQKLNYGGGEQWKEPGQWISWEIEVPEDGLYNIGAKYKQGYLDGFFSSRKIYIDGEVPFSEFNSVRFDFTTSWKNIYLGGEDCYVYLTAGKHTITMENVVGDLSQTMAVLQAAIDQLNDLYLAIVMITSSEPDQYRDYYLEEQLPNLPSDLKKIANSLSNEAKRIEQIVGKKGSENAYFEDVAYNLNSYADDIVGLTYKQRLTNLKNDISGLSSKLSTYQQQALDIDYLFVASADAKLPKTTMNFWQWLVYQVRMFIESFRTGRYKSTADEDSICVWMNTGTDQFQILQNMITDEFTPKTGIKVDLKLVQGSLIEAKVSGNGPDIQIGADSSAVVNLGLRGALEDLSKYDGVNELLDEYMEGADIPFTLEGHLYGIPNTNSFSVMFVRTDIFERMGLDIPQTWDDVYDVAQVLQRYNMSVGAAASFQTLLYQKGGSYYNEDLTEVMFTTDVAVEALTQHAEFYTKYGFPISFDFVSRFRTGEMPIAISGYNVYNTLKYSAPEISGLWKMFIMPGSIREDGSVNFTQVDNSLGGTIMLESAKNKDACWEFIKWWSGYEAQTRYSLDVEAALGIASRATTANLLTLKQLGWTREELAVLEDQASKIQFIPIVPGDYYVSRGVTNASRGVIYDGGNPRELLTEWTIKINDELRRKHLEFHKNN